MQKRVEESAAPPKPLNVHFSSATIEWPTPKAVYDRLNEEFGFTFDPCPLTSDVDRLALSYAIELDGCSSLFVPWRGKRVFCNPPYGPEIRKWLERADEADLAVYLVPARTDTRWFHEIVLPKCREIRFIKGRLKFGDAKNSAPFPSMIVIFKGGVAC